MFVSIKFDGLYLEWTTCSIHLGRVVQLEWITLSSVQISIQWIEFARYLIKINNTPILSTGQRFIHWIKLPTLRTIRPWSRQSHWKFGLSDLSLAFDQQTKTINLVQPELQLNSTHEKFDICLMPELSLNNSKPPNQLFLLVLRLFSNWKIIWIWL